jgi:hypothetical protein
VIWIVPKYWLIFKVTDNRKILRMRDELVFVRAGTACTGKGKGKAIPLQAFTGPEGSRRLMLPDFKKIGT